MQLQFTFTPNLNIAAETTVLTYTYSGASPVEVIARIDLGDATKPLAGGGTYTMNFYVNNVLVTPTSTTTLAAGVNQTIVVSRAVPLYTGDTVKLTVIGQASDLAVDVKASLRSATPLQSTDVFGTGPTAVDHNYGGANALAYQTAGGAGIVGAQVIVYLTSDYQAGNRGPAFIQGRTSTIAGGAWQHPLFLTPGNSAGNYTVLFTLPGLYGPDTVTITV